MTRKKVIHKLKAFPINDFSFVLFVLSSAGTYIKEFVHGDLDRTTPNIGSLIGCEVDIFQLDVFQLYDKLNEETLLDFDKTATIHPELM
jgi:tRNA pseudouridine synthase 10